MTLNKLTGKLYGETFTSFTDKDFIFLKRIVSPQPFDEGDVFLKEKTFWRWVGHASASFSQYGFKEIVSVDMSAKNISRLKQKLADHKSVKFMNMDTDSSPPDLKYCNTIYLNGVLHHTQNPEKLIKETYSRLSANGTFIVRLYGKGEPFHFQ